MANQNTSAPPKLNWVKNDLEKFNYFTDGSRLLVMYTKVGVQLFEIVVIDTDGDYFGLVNDQGMESEVKDWKQVEYFHLLYGEQPCHKSQMDDE